MSDPKQQDPRRIKKKRTGVDGKTYWADDETWPQMNDERGVMLASDADMKAHNAWIQKNESAMRAPGGSLYKEPRVSLGEVGPLQRKKANGNYQEDVVDEGPIKSMTVGPLETVNPDAEAMKRKALRIMVFGRKKAESMGDE